MAMQQKLVELRGVVEKLFSDHHLSPAYYSYSRGEWTKTVEEVMRETKKVLSEILAERSALIEAVLEKSSDKFAAIAEIRSLMRGWF